MVDISGLSGFLSSISESMGFLKELSLATIILFLLALFAFGFLMRLLRDPPNPQKRRYGFGFGIRKKRR